MRALAGFGCGIGRDLECPGPRRSAFASRVSQLRDPSVLNKAAKHPDSAAKMRDRRGAGPIRRIAVASRAGAAEPLETVCRRKHSSIAFTTQGAAGQATHCFVPLRNI
jgi:hypothetical protein